MISVLRYGIDSSLSLDLPAETLVARCNAPRGEPLVRVDEDNATDIMAAR